MDNHPELSYIILKREREFSFILPSKIRDEILQDLSEISFHFGRE